MIDVSRVSLNTMKKTGTAKTLTVIVEESHSGQALEILDLTAYVQLIYLTPGFSEMVSAIYSTRGEIIGTRSSIRSRDIVKPAHSKTAIRIIHVIFIVIQLWMAKSNGILGDSCQLHSCSSCIPLIFRFNQILKPPERENRICGCVSLDTSDLMMRHP